MTKNITLPIDDDLYEKFHIALKLNKDEASYVIEEFMKNYIFSSFSKASREYVTSHTIGIKSTSIEEPKALSRIPLWAKRKSQINHKIIKAYFQIEEEMGSVPLFELEKRCLDKANHPDVFIPTFKSNYSQMKLDAPKSHGKVFEDIEDKVVIWEKIKPTLLEYKEYFK